MLREYETIVFDLDGTLVDSAPVLKLILNQMRLERKLQPHPIELYRAWSSEGGSKLIAKSLEIPEAEAGRDLARFRSVYAMTPTAMQCVYSDAASFLSFAKNCGIRLGLCTNKPSLLAYKVLDETSLAKYFSAVVCGDTLSLKKPNPEPLLEVLKVLNVDRKKALFIGDSGIDKKTASAAGVDFLLFRSGYDLALEATYSSQSFTSYRQLIEKFS